MIGLDTNVLVRYFAQDDKEQSILATKLIDSLSKEAPGFISVVTVVELTWVMRSVYHAPKEKIIEVIGKLLRINVFVVENSEVLTKALKKYTESTADFADCMIARASLHYGCKKVVTFDKKAAATATMVLLGAEDF